MERNLRLGVELVDKKSQGVNPGFQFISFNLLNTSIKTEVFMPKS